MIGQGDVVYSERNMRSMHEVLNKSVTRHVDGERAPGEGRMKGCQVVAWGIRVGCKHEVVQNASQWKEVLQVRHA